MSYIKQCYTHGGPYVEGDGEGCQDERCVELRNLPAPTEPLWKIGWLKESNKIGQTANEFREEIYENARREGRDIRRV